MQRQTISFLLFILWGFTNCSSPTPNTITGFSSLPDTLFVPLSMAHKYGEIPRQEPLIDSLTKLYISQVHEGSRFTFLDPTAGYYKAYSEGVYQFSKKNYGRIIRFEPDGNAYYSVQLFIFDNKGDIVDALELAYLFGEEGANGEGDSYIIKTKNSTKVFVKQYWVNYLGEDAEFTEKRDTILAYEIKNGNKIALSIDSMTENKIRNLFLN